MHEPPRPNEQAQRRRPAPESYPLPGTNRRAGSGAAPVSSSDWFAGPHASCVAAQLRRSPGVATTAHSAPILAALARGLADAHGRPAKWSREVTSGAAVTSGGGRGG